MAIHSILKFFNSIQLHYEKLNSVNESDIHLFDEEDLIAVRDKSNYNLDTDFKIREGC